MMVVLVPDRSTPRTQHIILLQPWPYNPDQALQKNHHCCADFLEILTGDWRLRELLAVNTSNNNNNRNSRGVPLVRHRKPSRTLARPIELMLTLWPINRPQEIGFIPPTISYTFEDKPTNPFFY